jgi:hypothetical protein
VDRAEAHAALDSVGEAMESQHDDAQGRLTQFRSHLATLKMVVDHLFDHADNADSAAAEKKG